MQVKITLTVNEREHAALLAAIRTVQHGDNHEQFTHIMEVEYDCAPALTMEEFDALVEDNLNV